jgi:peptidoglycan hydrolase-like protein with peptidoglycan-binding domain
MKIKEITEGIGQSIMNIISRRNASGPGSDFTQWSDQPGNNAPMEKISLKAGPPYPPDLIKAVTQLQGFLQKLGYSVGSAGLDGKYGPSTINAVTAFKKDNNISGDGSSLSADEINLLMSSTGVANPTPTGNEEPGDQDQEEPQDQKPNPDPIDTEMEKVNANIKRKVDYLVKQGVLQSGRITDTERQYIDSVDVYVDPNKFANTPSSEAFIKATPPHVSNYRGSVQIPLSEWQQALGRDGAGLSGYVVFNLTDAGWWSNDFKAYVNPGNKLDDLITSYQK